MRAAPFEDLKGYLDRWAAVRMSCAPADRTATEEGIRVAYATAGLAPPERIIWCGGPARRRCGRTPRSRPSVSCRIAHYSRFPTSRQGQWPLWP
jgi:hypothetical protein